MDLLAAEITARTGKDPGEHYRELTAEFGTPYYTRIDAPATPEQKARLRKLSPEAVKASTLAGEPIIAKLTRAPGNDAPIGGLKVVAASGWFAARPSGHREHLQDLRGELQERGAPGCDRQRGAGDGERCADRGRFGKATCRMTAGTRSCSRFRRTTARAGILAHVTSLPSAYGIGDLGPTARRWIDRLHAAGQSWWQALPLGPTGYGNSPYQSLSSFAANELLISPDDLVEDGLLQPGDRDCDCRARRRRLGRLRRGHPVQAARCSSTAWRNFGAGARPDLRSAFAAFCSEQSHWLDDYALFRALKTRFAGAAYLDWPGELVRREPAALEAARRELAAPCEETRFAQFLFSARAAG